MSVQLLEVGTSVVDEFAAAVDRLIDADPGVFGDGEAVVGLCRQLERVGAAATRAVAAFDASRTWEASGARTAAAWLATECRLPAATAQGRVRLGRTLRHLPVTEAAWLAGDIGEAQVGALCRAHTPATADAMVEHEEMLVDEAKRLRFGSFTHAVAYWAMLADPDGAENRAAKLHDGRRLHLSKGLDGVRFLDGVTDPIGGDIVAAELKRIDDELFAADWAEAKARVGEGVCAADLARTPAQRRMDALVEMATRSASARGGGRRPEPLFSVFIGYETFAGMLCELADGTVLSPASLRPWLDEAWIERVVFDGPSRVIDVGVTRRLFDGATRRAVELRDRECFHPYCDTPAADCDVDHVQPWSAGGPTTQANGRLACGFHNRARQRSP
ncbi:MAG TPA: DUF222 domain-containing protein [Acidimicrobiales bacterium]|jgi:hypothetical protein|nr:DUF222 domain-containing protein [Acidimicrobiales bacterium]